MAPGETERLLLIGDREADQRKLIASPASDHAALAGKFGPEPYCDRRQQTVPALVAERAVDLSELGEVHQQQCEAVAGRDTCCRRFAQVFLQPSPVGKAGESVVVVLVAQPFGEGPRDLARLLEHRVDVDRSPEVGR